MKRVNHYEANSEFRSLYSDFEYATIELQHFLTDIHKYISDKQARLSKAEIYSAEFEELFWSNSHDQIFKHSVIITICSVGEMYMKEYCSIWANLKSFDLKDFNLASHLFDGFKEIANKKLKLGIDFSKKEVVELKALFAIRNSLVHSNGTIENSHKSFALVRQLSENYDSLKLFNNKFIAIEEQFCHDALVILKKFVFYVISKAIRRFPRYRAEEPKWLVK